LQRAINRAFDSRIGHRTAEYPPLNVAANENEVLVTAELPGVDPKDIDITVQGGSFTLKGRRKAEERKENERYHRQERSSGSFARTLELPYNLDAEKVQASLKNGVLRVVLPRAEDDKPRKVRVES
jgi:HSP20 family protein